MNEAAAGARSVEDPGYTGCSHAHLTNMVETGSEVKGRAFATYPGGGGGGVFIKSRGGAPSTYRVLSF